MTDLHYSGLVLSPPTKRSSVKIVIGSDLVLRLVDDTRLYFEKYIKITPANSAIKWAIKHTFDPKQYPHIDYELIRKSDNRVMEYFNYTRRVYLDNYNNILDTRIETEIAEANGDCNHMNNKHRFVEYILMRNIRENIRSDAKKLSVFNSRGIEHRGTISLDGMKLSTALQIMYRELPKIIRANVELTYILFGCAGNNEYNDNSYNQITKTIHINTAIYMMYRLLKRTKENNSSQEYTEKIHILNKIRYYELEHVNGDIILRRGKPKNNQLYKYVDSDLCKEDIQTMLVSFIPQLPKV
jgi:hypothetical protein